MTIIDWTKYFDQIYCIHFLPDKEKLKSITKELKRVGILDSGIFRFHYTFKTPFDEYIFSHVKPIDHKFVTHARNSAINITIANYHIFKHALALGYNHILMLEDDVIFPNKLDRTKEYLDNMPEDYDFIQMDRTNPTYSMLANLKIGRYYHGNYSGGFFSSACNALSAKACAVGAEMTETDFHVSDLMFAFNKDERLKTLHRYVIANNLVKQDYRPYDHCYKGLIDFSDFYPREKEIVSW
jgi:hypothetical protein